MGRAFQHRAIRKGRQTMPLKTPVKLHFTLVAICLTSISLNGCTTTPVIAMTSTKGTTMTLSQTIPSNTRCFGRYLIDISSDFDLSQSYAHRAGDIDRIPNSDQRSFDELVKAREVGLKSKPLNKEGKGLYVDTLNYTHTQRIVRYYKSIPNPYITDLDGYVLVGKTTYKFNSGTDSDRLDYGTKWLADTLARVRARHINEIPTEPGFCIDGAFIQGNDNVYESATIGMAPENQPAVRIVFDSSTPNAVFGSLMTREDGVKGFFDDFDKLRRGKRVINGIEGEESLLRTTNEQGKVIHLFTWESKYAKADNRHPKIQIEMSAGGPTNKMASPYTDQEAIQFWDAITSTVRLRPGAF